MALALRAAVVVDGDPVILAPLGDIQDESWAIDLAQQEANMLAESVTLVIERKHGGRWVAASEEVVQPEE